MAEGTGALRFMIFRFTGMNGCSGTRAYIFSEK